MTPNKSTKSGKRAVAGVHLKEKPPKKLLRQRTTKSKTPLMPIISAHENTITANRKSRRKSTMTLTTDSNTTEKNDENHCAAETQSRSSTNKDALHTASEPICNMCNRTEHHCMNLSTNHTTVLTVGDITRLPSWNIRQILTSICSRCLVYIGALTESSNKLRLRCEMALQSQVLSQPLAPPTPDACSSDMLLLSVPSPEASSEVASPTNPAAPITIPPAPSTPPTQLAGARQTSTPNTRSVSPNDNTLQNSMLEIHHERALSPLSTESGGANNKGSTQAVPDPLRCKVCNRLYKMKHFYTKHIRSCKAVVKSVASDSRPRTLPHVVPLTFHCNICTFTVDSKAKLLLHKRIHNKRHSCDICGRECTTIVEYGFHRAECKAQQEAHSEMINNSDCNKKQPPPRRKTRLYSRYLAQNEAHSETEVSPNKETPSTENNPADALSTVTNNKTNQTENYQNGEEEQYEIERGSMTNYAQRQEELSDHCSVYTANHPENAQNIEEEPEMGNPADEIDMGSIRNYAERHNDPTTYDHCSANTTNQLENGENCEEGPEIGNRQYAHSTITNYVQRHKELYDHCSVYSESQPENDLNFEEEPEIGNPAEEIEMGSIRNYAERHNDPTTYDHYSANTTNRLEDGENCEEGPEIGNRQYAHSTITNYAQRHKELYDHCSVYSASQPENDENCEEQLEIGNRQDAHSTITNYAQRHKELYDHCSVYSESQPENDENCEEQLEIGNRQDAHSTITNYVQRHKELYGHGSVYSAYCPENDENFEEQPEIGNRQDAHSTITNYVQRHKELYDHCSVFTENQPENDQNFEEQPEIGNRQDAHSTVTNYVQRHKELYGHCSVDDIDEEEDAEDEVQVVCVSPVYTLFSNRTKQWVEEGGSSSHMSPSDIYTPDCKTKKEYELYLLQRLKREVQQRYIACFESMCHFRAFSLNDMMLHDYIDHYKKPRYYCPKCDHCFTSKVFLDYHLDLQDYGRYVCNKCAVEFVRQRHLDLHLIQHDRVVNKIKCLQCNMEFVDKEQRLKHCAIEQHNWRHRNKSGIRIQRSMTIKNKVPLKKRPRKAGKSKYSVKVLNLIAKPTAPSKRCIPKEKYLTKLPARQIGQVVFDNALRPNCIGATVKSHGYNW